MIVEELLKFTATCDKIYVLGFGDIIDVNVCNSEEYEVVAEKEIRSIRIVNGKMWIYVKGDLK